MTRIDKRLRMAWLYDFYQPLLTEKQRRCLDLYYLQDWSLAEIADDFGISRQAVHDLLRRAERTLESYEAKLGLVERFRQQQQQLAGIETLLSDLAQALAEDASRCAGDDRELAAWRARLEAARSDLRRLAYV